MFPSDRLRDAAYADHAVTSRTSILRLEYIRVTACRTDFCSFFEPPGLNSFTSRHSLEELHAHKEPRGLASVFQEGAFLQFREGLAKLLLGVHDNRAVPGYRLFERLA